MKLNKIIKKKRENFQNEVGRNERGRKGERKVPPFIKITRRSSVFIHPSVTQFKPTKKNYLLKNSWMGFEKREIF